MKDNKVLSTIYGIALFVALIGAIGLLYSSIELFQYTSLGDYSLMFGHNGYYMTKAFYEFQKIVVVPILIAAIFAIVGVVGGTSYIFSKKQIFKVVFSSCIVATVIVTLAAMISVNIIWNSYFSKNGAKLDVYSIIYGQNMTTCYALFSTTMSSLIQNLVCFAVILALPAYEFGKQIIEKIKNRKNKENENSSVEELQESLNNSEKE